MIKFVNKETEVGWLRTFKNPLKILQAHVNHRMIVQVSRPACLHVNTFNCNRGNSKDWFCSPKEEKSSNLPKLLSSTTSPTFFLLHAAADVHLKVCYFLITVTSVKYWLNYLFLLTSTLRSFSSLCWKRNVGNSCWMCICWLKNCTGLRARIALSLFHQQHSASQEEGIGI